MRLQDFDFSLPPGLIAQQPAAERDASRLMVLDRGKGALAHRVFSDLPEYLNPGDVLVVNETEVLPVRLLGRKESGGKAEVLLVRREEDGSETAGGTGTIWRTSSWECLVKGAGRKGTALLFGEDLRGELLDCTPAGLWRIFLRSRGDIEEVLDRTGYPPLPPYIRRNGDPEMRGLDLRRYQTVFARRRGAIAAPTAGLHFTERLLERIRSRGVSVVALTLHVGLGTFLPVKEEEVEAHRLAPEFFDVSPAAAAAVNLARSVGKKVFAVGTTVARAVESCVDSNGMVEAKQGATDLFIFPGYRFRAVDRLITNFHLPRSTLLMLVAAFAGRERVLAAYEEAVKEKYRFYSYGDAMLIL